ncbi:MAG TPA: radical SAM protein [Verrucomicrobiae bacterium]|nr:radical SAM protein [Verrucomicrobiae bacterium]
MTALPNPPSTLRRSLAGTECGCPRDFLGQRHVYAFVSPRMGGISAGVNLNPDRKCNFACVYCEVNRAEPPPAMSLDLDEMIAELKATLDLISSGAICQRPAFQKVPAGLACLRLVTLSGDGEPTLSPVFVDAVEAIVHLRARARASFFKLVLLTNASGLDRPEVARSLELFTVRDEIWAKLDAGTQAGMDRLNRGDRPLADILENILELARRRPVVIQSLFPALGGEAPDAADIEEYALRLRELVERGAQIPLVQICSAMPTPFNAESGHLPLRKLSAIARRVREVTGLKAAVF